MVLYCILPLRAFILLMPAEVGFMHICRPPLQTHHHHHLPRPPTSIQRAWLVHQPPIMDVLARGGSLTRNEQVHLVFCCDDVIWPRRCLPHLFCSRDTALRCGAWKWHLADSLRVMTAGFTLTHLLRRFQKWHQLRYLTGCERLYVLPPRPRVQIKKKTNSWLGQLNSSGGCDRVFTLGSFIQLIYFSLPCLSSAYAHGGGGWFISIASSLLSTTHWHKHTCSMSAVFKTSSCLRC